MGRIATYRSSVLRWLYALVVGAVVSGFAFLLVTGEYTKDGPVILRLVGNHGVHRGDLFVLAGWLVAVLAVLALTIAARRADRET